MLVVLPINRKDYVAACPLRFATTYFLHAQLPFTNYHSLFSAFRRPSSAFDIGCSTFSSVICPLLS